MNEVVKFGITSGNSRLRLSHHKRDGFDQIVRLIEGNSEVLKLENAWIAAMRTSARNPFGGASTSTSAGWEPFWISSTAGSMQDGMNERTTRCG
ncbi:hypothetical protein [Streptomyces sp. NPDC057966]|uniref:hypothetical protein n=1 Tax=Streptomyces sp. NPDC057966 TaxID=3346292 RepID=UPI0036E3E14E